MATTPEGRVKTKIKQFLKKQGVYFFSPIGGPYSTQGVPDIICCVQGYFLAIEVKAPGREKQVTDLQWHNIKAINEAGGRAIVATSVEQVENVFEEQGWLTNESKPTNAKVARKANVGRRTSYRADAVNRHPESRVK